MDACYWDFYNSSNTIQQLSDISDRFVPHNYLYIYNNSSFKVNNISWQLNH